MQKFIEEFTASLIQKGRSKKTIHQYVECLEFFLKFSEQKIDLESVERFKLYMVEDRGSTKKTANHYLVALRVFLKFLSKKHPPETPMPIEHIELFERVNHQKSLDLPTNEEMKTFLLHEDTQQNDAIVNLLAGTGMRVSEMLSLTVDAFGKGEKIKVTGKGSKERIVYPTKLARKKVINHLENRRVPPSVYALFANERSEMPLTPRAIQKMIAERSDYLLGEKKITPHTLRHWYATQLIKKGQPIELVQKILGHSSIATTQIYTHPTEDMLKDAADSLNN